MDERTGFLVDTWKWAEKNVAKGLGWIIAKIQGLSPAEVLADVERQYGMRQTEREEARQARREEIERGVQERTAAIGAAAAQAAAQRRAAREAELAGLGKGVADAQRELDEALAEAKRKRDEAKAKAAVEAEGRGGFPMPGELAGVGAGVFGTFSAAAAMRMGAASSVQERTAKACEEIAANTKAIQKGVQDLEMDWSD